MSLMDVVIGTALLLTVFLALTSLLRTSLVVASLSKNKSVATAIAESQMEYVRSLTYDAVGTVGGIPAGNIPQYSTTTANGLDFVTRTYIEYVDDSADGTEGADENGITTDYKRVKVSVAYTAADRAQTIDLISHYAPPGIETTTGGGTLRIDVVNANGSAVAGASVHIENPSLSPSVDLTTFSNANGVVYLPGAFPSTEYRITVTKNGYSSAQTYERNTTNQNPAPGYLTVALGQTTTGTFAIDVLTNLAITTFSPIASSTWTSTFENPSEVGAQSNVVVAGGSVTLASNEFGYVSPGSVQSIVIEPEYLAGWMSARISTVVLSGTNVRLKVANDAGVPLPDGIVPGNSAGFTDEVDLSGVSIETYPALTLVAELMTDSAAATPALLEWTLEYLEGPVPLPDVDFTLTGGKTIGSTGAGASLYKTEIAASTDATAGWTSTLEWDVYGIDVPGYDVVDACNAPPYTLAPGSTLAATLVLGDETTHRALVSVTAAGAPIEGAEVTLARTGFSTTTLTSACGAAYFGDLTSANDYTITATASGQTDVTMTGAGVSGQSFHVLSF